MKQFLLIFIICVSISSSFAQNHLLPDWVEDLPRSAGSKEIYAIGISDPRMTDKELSKEIALHRAITMAVMLNESHVFYASDYFEKKSEEYRWYILKENIEELGKVNAYAWVDEKSYQIVQTHENTNGETMVLIKYFPTISKDTNFIVNGEYYNQVFEVSNTRALESIRSVKLNTSWKKNTDTDSLNTFFLMTNWNNSTSAEIKFGEIEIKPPGYSYQYESSIPDTFAIQTYNTSVKLQKGLWVAYIDSYMQSIMRISKNYSSKMGTVYDDFKVNRNDGISEYSTESLARSSCSNIMGFEYGGMGINKNCLYPRIYMKGNRSFYSTYAQKIAQEKQKEKEKKKKKCIFRKR